MKYYAKVYEGLIDPKHYQQMGPAIWLYMYLLVKETYGPVERRPVVSDADLARAIGCGKRVIRDWRERLLANGYIEVTLHSRGYAYTITKSKKFTFLESDGGHENVNQADVSGRRKNVNHESVDQTTLVRSFPSCGTQFFVAKSSQTLAGSEVALPNKVIKGKSSENSPAAVKAEGEFSSTNPDQKHIAAGAAHHSRAEERVLGVSVFSSPSDGGKNPRSICAAELKRQMRSRRNGGHVMHVRSKA